MAFARRGSAFLFAAVAALCAGTPPEARAKDLRAVLHEPIPPDPRDDARAAVRLDGDLPAAITTPQGVIVAPDPGRGVEPGSGGTEKAPYAPEPGIHAPDSTFAPDRDTRSPDLTPYDEPFTPSTAPFKRLSAYDTVNANYTLSVRNAQVTPLALRGNPARPGEERFFADIVVELAPGRRVRIPSVGPGARVVRSRAGVGPRDVRFDLYRDGAENWFVVGDRTERVRLVMELAIPRDALGGTWGDPSWNDLPRPPALPDNAAAAATEVAARIGVSHASRPREVVSKLTAYFRSFKESDAPLPSTGGDIYLDLALHRKGVCRHRAFAFLVTAIHLGLPTRMIVNETHAWVEVHDGKLFRRIDLGGAGQLSREQTSPNTPYAPPPDPFSWPAGAAPTDAAGRSSGAAPAASSAAPTSSGSPATAASGAASAPSGANDPVEGEPATSAAAPAPAPSPSASAGAETDRDERPRARITLGVFTAKPKRGAALAVRGEASAEEAQTLRAPKTVPCAHLPIAIVLVPPVGARAPRVEVGKVATDEHGRFDAELVLPPAMALGDYDVRAYTSGDARCGPSGSP